VLYGHRHELHKQARYFIDTFLKQLCITVKLCCRMYCLCVNVYWTTATGISGHFSTTLTEGFPCFFLSLRQMPGYNSQRRGKARISRIFKNLFIMYVPFSIFCVLFACKCVLYYCHRVSTQLQLKINK
jgi:hypothetical protein